ncbi:hypothetical protein D3C72_1711770 [compost metagenome]
MIIQTPFPLVLSRAEARAQAKASNRIGATLVPTIEIHRMKRSASQDKILNSVIAGGQASGERALSWAPSQVRHGIWRNADAKSMPPRYMTLDT